MNWNAAAIALICFLCVSGDNKTIIMEAKKDHWEIQCTMNMAESKYFSCLSNMIGGVLIQLNALIQIDAPCPSQFLRLNAHIYFQEFDAKLSFSQ